MSTFKAPCALTDTVFFYNTAKTLSKIYKILNKTSAYYENMSTDIRNAIVKNFVDTSTHIVSGDCQTSDGAILFNGIFEDDTQTFNHLLTKISQNSNHLDYGILGSKFVLNTLGEHKRADIIYEMLSVPTFPSYKHILSLGATTLYECWNGEGSHNHHMFSDVSAVMYKYFAGISVSEEHPGFREFKLCPTLFESLDFMNCSFDSPHGIISIRWKKLHKIVTLEINIPFGTTAYLTLPQIKSRLIKSGIHKFTFSQEGTEGNLTEL